jgi:DNA invertase Pin-like site-specific DNA recombinase
MKTYAPELLAQVGLMTAAGRSQKAIASALSITPSKCSRIQQRLKINPRRSLKRTQRQREKVIRKMTRKREPQDKIARACGMTRTGVWRAQQRLGLVQFVRERMPSEEKQRQILALTQARVPISRIQLALGVGRKIILTVARRGKNG